MNKKYYLNYRFTFSRLYLFVITIGSIGFFILTLFFHDFLFSLYASFWLFFLFYIEKKKRHKENNTYLQITDKKISLIVFDEEKKYFYWNEILTYYEAPDKRVIVLVGRYLDQGEWDIYYDFNGIEEIRILLESKVNKQIVLDTVEQDKDYLSSNFINKDEIDNSIYTLNDRAGFIIFFIVIFSSALLVIYFHILFIFVPLFILFSILSHLYITREIILTDSYIKKKSLIDETIIHYKNIDKIQMVNVTNTSNHSVFPMMEINSIELYGFLNNYELNEEIYKDLKRRIEFYRESK